MSSVHLSAGRPWVARPRSSSDSAPWDVFAPSIYGGPEGTVASFLSEDDAVAIAAAHEMRDALSACARLLNHHPDLGFQDNPVVQEALAALRKAGVR